MAALVIDHLGKDSPDKALSALENTLQGIRLDADEAQQKQRIAEAMSLMDNLKLATEAPDVDASAAKLSQMAMDDDEEKSAEDRTDEEDNKGKSDSPQTRAPATPTPADTFHFTTPAAAPAPRDKDVWRGVNDSADEERSTASGVENRENESKGDDASMYGFHLGLAKPRGKAPSRKTGPATHSGAPSAKGFAEGTPKVRRRRKSKGSPNVATMPPFATAQNPVNLAVPPAVNGRRDQASFTFTPSAFMPPPPPPPPPEPVAATTRLNARVRREPSVDESESANKNDSGAKDKNQSEGTDAGRAAEAKNLFAAAEGTTQLPVPPVFDRSRVSFTDQATDDQPAAANVGAEASTGAQGGGAFQCHFSLGKAPTRKSPDKKAKRRARKTRPAYSAGLRSSGEAKDLPMEYGVSMDGTSSTNRVPSAPGFPSADTLRGKHGETPAADRSESPTRMEVDSDGSFGRENQEPHANPNLETRIDGTPSDSPSTPVKQTPGAVRTPRRRVKAKAVSDAVNPDELGVKHKQRKHLLNVEEYLEEIDSKAKAAREAYNRGDYGAAAMAYEDAFRIGLDIRRSMAEHHELHGDSDEVHVTESALGRFQGNCAAALMMHGQYRLAIKASEKATTHDQSLLRVHCRYREHGWSIVETSRLVAEQLFS
eukprot:scaffold7508_cov267-Pinguiococcus_pyrenoidosus.AAC.7